MPHIPIGDPYEDEPYPGTTFIPMRPAFIPMPVKLPIFYPVPIPVPTPVPYPVEPWKTSARCPRCGMDFSGVTGYVCGSTSCPMQPNVVSDSTTFTWGT